MNEIAPKGKKAPKKGKGKEKKYPDNLTRQIVGSGIISIIAIAGIAGGIFLNLQKHGPEESIFVMGFSGGLHSMDPLIVEPSTSFIETQIVEPLFTEKLNQTSLYHENVPHLAEEGIWSEDGLNFTCILREGIYFHDETRFNATSVKWNFDRLHRLFENISNPSLWIFTDGSFIINKTIVIDENIVRFVLNRPFAGFPSLLSSLRANIISPTSSPSNRFLDIDNEKLVGTGPYTFKSNFVNENTTIVANDNYWGYPKPTIDRFIFLNYDYIESNEKFFDHKTDYAAGIDLLFPDYNNDPTIIIDDFVGREYQYLGMNNKRINTTMRKAISFALNYSNILETKDLYSNGSVIKCKSPLPLGTLYSNWEDFDVPNLNISFARKVLIDNKWPGTENLTANNDITLGNEWELVTNSLTPLATFNISHIIGDRPFLENLSYIITNNLKQIGVKLINHALTLLDYHITHPFFGGDTDIWWIGTAPLYNDPAHLINYHFSNDVDGIGNVQYTNDSILQSWMEEATVETDSVLRNQLYYNIQKRLIEDIFPFIWLFSPIWYDIYRSNLKGWGEWGAGAFRNLYFD